MISGDANLAKEYLNLTGFITSYKAAGIRLDSGDLAYLSVQCREIFVNVEKYVCVCFADNSQPSDSKRIQYSIL